MTSMTPNPDQNAVQSPAQDSAAQPGNTTQQGGAQRSARSLMNSLYRSPRALSPAPHSPGRASPYLPATCTYQQAHGIPAGVEWLG